LGEIALYVPGQRWDAPELKRAANEYLRLIPKDLGRARDKLKLDRIFPDDAALQDQNNILDSLQASVDSMTQGPANTKLTNTGADKVFRAKINNVTDGKIIKEIDALFNKTKQSIHVSNVYKMSKVYSLDIESMRSAWEKDGAKMSNVWRLWHGTNYANLLSIIYKGLQVPKSYTNGWNFGAGLYFSDQSTKSLNYAAGYWDNSFGSIQRCFMFLADVAMGKSWSPSGSGQRTRPSGFDSTFAEAKKSGIRNNEMIVPRASQANLVYLIEFTR
jgi:poly [ADP-ribose] polymerase 2/3/4